LVFPGNGVDSQPEFTLQQFQHAVQERRQHGRFEDDELNPEDAIGDLPHVDLM
jgi:hypothetical protein